jgi:hypothetical protein
LRGYCLGLELLVVGIAAACGMRRHGAKSAKETLGNCAGATGL